MRIVIVLSLLAALGGCSMGVVVPPQAWNYDPTPPQPKVSLPPEQVAALTDRAAQLQIERNAIRARISNERDIWARQQQYVELHRVGMELSPLERRIAGVAAAR